MFPSIVSNSNFFLTLLLKWLAVMIHVQHGSLFFSFFCVSKDDSGACIEDFRNVSAGVQLMALYTENLNFGQMVTDRIFKVFSCLCISLNFE